MQSRKHISLFSGFSYGNESEDSHPVRDETWVEIHGFLLPFLQILRRYDAKSGENLGNRILRYQHLTPNGVFLSREIFYRKTLFLFIFAFLFPFFSLHAQFLGSKSPDKGRIWNIRFTIDGAAFPIDLAFKDGYQGESLVTKVDPNGVQYSDWEWMDWDSVTTLNPLDNLQRHFRLGVEVNLWRGLYAGFNYSGYFVRQFNRNGRSFGSGTTIPFGTLEGQLGYSITFKKLPRFTIQPSVFGGTYASDIYDGYEGVGQEIALGGKIALGLILSKKHGHMFRIWAGRQDLIYREVEESYVYPGKTRQYHSHWTFVNAGFGLMWNISFVEDR
ncbi:MAG: hypothetical protein KDE26_22740 [Bacteroidetes bacterium]|nr:hypothetical protein [Bacteroidota bacterium]